MIDPASVAFGFFLGVACTFVAIVVAHSVRERRARIARFFAGLRRDADVVLESDLAAARSATDVRRWTEVRGSGLVQPPGRRRL